MDFYVTARSRSRWNRTFIWPLVFLVLLFLTGFSILSKIELHEGGDIGLLITIYPKVLKYISYLFIWLNSFGDYYSILIGWFIKLSVQMFQPIFVIYRRGNFVNHPFWSKRLRDFLMISLQQVCACTWCFWTWCCWCLVGESCPPTRPA